MVRSRSATTIRVAASYVVLIVFSIIALYPVWQIVNISLRPADRLLSTSLELIPDQASLQELRRPVHGAAVLHVAAQ